METKHTPGPWYYSKVEELGSTHFYIAQQEGAPYTPNYSDVSFSTCSGEYVDIQEANARLIAAAPELLEACQTFAEWLRREDEGFVRAGRDRSTPEGEEEWREWFNENLRICNLAQEQARSAITKATGSN